MRGKQLVGDAAYARATSTNWPCAGERRLDVRPQQRDLGLGDAADRLARRAHELQALLAADERRERRGRARTARRRVGPKRRSNGRGSANPAPRQIAAANVGVDPGLRADLRERPALAVGPQAPERGEAQEPALLVACTSSGIDAPISSVR